MKKILVAGISLFLATTVSASMFTDKSLPMRCNDISEKLQVIAKKQIRDECGILQLEADVFKVIGNMIAQNDLYSAKNTLVDAIIGLDFAINLECKGLSIMNWARSEGVQIKKAVS